MFVSAGRVVISHLPASARSVTQSFCLEFLLQKSETQSENSEKSYQALDCPGSCAVNASLSSRFNYIPCATTGPGSRSLLKM